VPLLKFDAETRTTDLSAGRVIGVRVDPESRMIESIVVRPDSYPGGRYVVPRKMIELSSPLIQIDCTASELEPFDQSTVTEVLPASAGARCYPSWQPLQQVREDLKNPFGRVVVGRTRLLLQGSEVEIVANQFVFGTDGVVGRMRGVVTADDFEEVTELLLEQVKFRRNPMTVPIDLLVDWRTMDLGASSRQLGSFAHSRSSEKHEVRNDSYQFQPLLGSE